MSATSATTISPPPPLRAEKQKVFPKPEKVRSTAAKFDLPKIAVPYQPHFRIGSGISENPFPPDPYSDWGINEESL